MIANANWPRWVFASIAQHFKDACDDNDLPLLIEGLEDRLADKIRTTDHAELRINGPNVDEVSHNCFQLTVGVNILIQSYMTQQNRYNLMQNCGVMLEAITTIPLFKYGNGVDDDQTQFGCLYLTSETRDRGIKIHHFGQVKPDVRIRESIVSVSYYTTLP